MSALPSLTPRCRNRLLATLSEEQFGAIAPRLQTVSLTMKQTLFERNTAMQYVYFPCDSVLSVLAYMLDGTGVEVGTVGNEGLIGGIEMLAGAECATETVVCQIEGECLRMRVDDFREAIAGETPLRRITQRYLLVYLNLVSQSVACNRLHTIEERFARWILMIHDRVQGDDFYLTQEFVADMLGVHRPGVSLVAGAFQQAGFIRYTRGHMSILDRHGLEDMACECYGLVKEQFEALLHIS